MPQIINIVEEMQACETRFNSLFDGLNENDVLKNNRASLIKAYWDAFENQTSVAGELEVLAEYNHFIENLTKVKLDGNSAYDVYNDALNHAQSRKTAVILYNIAKVFELIFWFSLFMLAAVTAINIGIPLIFLNPLLGITMTLAFGLLSYVTFKNFSSGLDTIKTYEGLPELATAEQNCIRFFAPANAFVAPLHSIEPEKEISFCW
jgi:hypothetical protein